MYPTRAMSQNSKDVVVSDDPSDDRRRAVSRTRGVKCATGHSVVSDQASCGNFASGRTQIRLRNTIRIGTWNARGLLETGKLRIVENECKRNKIDIVGLCETHWKGSGHFDTENNRVYFSGNDSSSFSGVAIAIPKKLSNAVLGYNPVSDRIMTIKIDAAPMALNIVQVYAPTGNANENEVEDFYNKLETTMSSIPNREMLILLGDFNAKIGKTSDDAQLRNVIGKYGLGDRNIRGERLIQFAADNNLTIMNSVFKHHRRRLYTWTSPGGQHRNQIDYILIKSRWRSSVQNTHTLPGADCGTDHQLPIAKVQVKLKAPIVRKQQQRLEITNIRSFTEAIQRNQQQLSTYDDPESSWNAAKTNIKNIVRETQNRSLPPKRQHWMTNDTLELIEKRRQMKASGGKVQHLNEMNRAIQRACRKDKNSHLQNICAEVEEHADKHETKDLYKKIRIVTRQFKPKTWAIENSNGETVTDIKEITNVWKDYCGSLFLDPSPEHVEIPSSLQEMEPDILKDEVRAAIKHLKTSKAVGVDEIPIEVIKDMGENGVDLFHSICNLVWTTGQWPKDWSHSIFIPLHKKGSTKKCNNFRLISLIPHSSKILLHILNERLRAYLARHISPEQAGFVKGRGTREQILILRQIIEKAREFNTPLIICFVDFSKAFDSVKWGKLWKILLEMGVPKHLVLLLRQLYENNTASVRIDNMSSEEFHVQAGVRQGCILSPLLFNTYTEYIMRIILEQWDKGISISGNRISNLRYADDTTLLASNVDDIGELLQILETTSQEWGLAINREKTKMMIVDRQNNNKPEVTQIGNCEVVNSYIYLGSLISNKGGCEEEVKRRNAITRSAMEKMTKVWKDRNVTNATKIKLVRTLIFPILLYGAETWTLREQERKKIDALEMWCWRRMLRIPWTAHRTNISILRELKIEQRLSSTILSRILRYFGHVSRRENAMERLVIQGKVEGTRSRGRSPTRWTDQIKSATNSSLQDCTKKAKDRNKWREIISTVMSASQARD